MNKKDEYKNKFKKLVKENKANISNIEDLMIENIEEYKQELLKCTEDLLINCVNEKELISKKNEWNNKGIKLKNIGKRKIDFILITSKITIYRTILRIEDDIDLNDYNLKSKYIIPLDEYLGIDNLPFKISVKAMIKFAFGGQNQSSFQKASNIIKELYNIQISYTTIKDVTEFIGSLLFNSLLDNANKIWDNRANIDVNTTIKKGTLYIQADGAAVNTRIEDENGSTWKENKLGIFFSENNIYKRKNKSNITNHKEFVSYIGSVDTFRILVFAKAVELEYWKYENIVFISDGATWLRNMISELFPEAIQILDKFHLIENIYEYAKYIFNEDIKKVETFKDKIIGYCYSREYNLIIKELNKYKDIALPKTICNLSVYLENNKDKINYSLYEHNDWFVGSGAIESSNKTVVQLRLKQAGMRWSVDGANAILALRCYVESKNWNKIEKIVVDKIYH